MRVRIYKKKILLDDKEAEFEFNIKDYLIIKDKVIIRLEIPTSTIFNENVFALNKDAKIHWQVPERSYLSDNSPYVGLFKEGENVRLTSWDGVHLTIELETGKIINQEWIK